MSQPIRILLVDDHPLVRDGMRQLLAKHPDFEVIGEAENRDSVFKALTKAQIQPHIILMDISLPGRDGILIAKELRMQYPAIHIVFLSMHEEAEYARRAFQAGAKGYLLKSSGSDEILKGLRDVAAGGRCIASQMSLQLLDEQPDLDPHNNERAKFTDRELEILRYVAEGLSAKEIANRIHISHRTVEAHRLSLIKKMGAKNAIELVRLAEACGLLD